MDIKYRYQLIRLIQGHEGDHAPDVKEEVIRDAPNGTATGRFQKSRPGSYGEVHNIGFTEIDGGVVVEMYFAAYLPCAGHFQTLAAISDDSTSYHVVLQLTETGGFQLHIDHHKKPHIIPIDFKPNAKTWYYLSVTIEKQDVIVDVSPVARYAQDVGQRHCFHIKIRDAVHLNNLSTVTLAARRLPSKGSIEVLDHFNGRLEGVTIRTLGQQARLLARYDFSTRMDTDQIIDVSGCERHGKLRNAPTRAVRGHDWDGSEVDWTKAKYGYGAIHFHEDDLDDANWEMDFLLNVPKDTRSGAYAVEIRGVDRPEVFDKVTFFVRPHKDSIAKVALVLPTFTYLAYANECMWDQDRSSRLEVPSVGFKIREDEDLRKMKRRRDLGLSMYDVHRDGSGTVFSGSKRPILNVRPGYVHWAFQRPREFSADLLMIGFLERLGIDYDVVTDHDMHNGGQAAIAKYDTLMTGCHPEYHTIETLDTWTHFAQRGGNLMYLGGNGFYWRVSIPRTSPHHIEVRRGDQGVRTFELPGGERHHSSDGGQGGLWRSRGRPPNVLFGVGCCGEGIGPGVPYRRTDAARDESYSWVFEGIPDHELLGVHGFGGGASGDEIDSFNLDNGSPANTVVLASSTGHPDEFGLFPEESGFPMVDTLGTQTNRIRSDMTICQTSGGGHVFSVGSINWYSSLGWDAYNNNIAKLTENVLRRFNSGRYQNISKTTA
ncbi:hypothetical protein N0V83_010345 [Neocucurbitaria cava]|uniref:N,N-dimethylformamidase beta subunit-like C-terminal domain-containing protein n=1 Tax=Neocucurbitaria cava TaxID=798079 RepID=A0A9W8XZN5_9PLEO|nr:hypothetical protein N0V83_010345 [Neocucurbitaria cava]